MNPIQFRVRGRERRRARFKHPVLGLSGRSYMQGFSAPVS
ncbi:hypothetical protein D1AOALGA4SA_5366 [Olavius algarvensis Delta 1 endosymbiont]|nr:hypothetical protein D1AOALGA4SA_5366 [Olavius algarvensis Delta 1 endosymbiont]